MMKFYAKVTSNDLTKALSDISAWDGKTRLAIENVLQDSTKNIARGAKQKAAQRSGKLKKSIKTGFDRRKPEGMQKDQSREQQKKTGRESSDREGNLQTAQKEEEMKETNNNVKGLKKQLAAAVAMVCVAAVALGLNIYATRKKIGITG